MKNMVDEDNARSTVMSNLPDELLYYVMRQLTPPRRDKLYDGVHRMVYALEAKDGLCAASMVSHRWRACALPLLFCDLELNIGVDPEVQEAALEAAVRHIVKNETNLHHFHTFLQAHPVIARCIQTLLIKQTKAFAAVTIGRTGAYVVTFVEPNTLASVVRCLPALRTLGLQDIGVTTDSSHKFSGPPVPIQSLMVNTNSRADVFAGTVLGLFSHIGHLQLVLSTSEYRVPDDVGKVPLESGDGYSIDAAAFHQGMQLWPLRQACLRSSVPLRHFTIGYFSSYRQLFIEPLREFLVAVSTDLVSLRCSMSESFTPPPHIWDRLFKDLQWPELEHLTIMAKDISTSCFEEAEQCSSWYQLPDALSQFFSCGSLRSIRLLRDREAAYDPWLKGLGPTATAGFCARDERYTSSEAESRRRYYAAVERTLLKFGSLESAAFVMGTDTESSDEVEEQLIVQSMPNLHRSGLLRFDTLKLSDMY